MAAFCTDTHSQPTLPLINSNVHNVLLQIFLYSYQTMPKFINKIS